jgi:hypothetical protein
MRLLQLTVGTAEFVDAVHDKHVARMKTIIDDISDAEIDGALALMRIFEGDAAD